MSDVYARLSCTHVPPPPRAHSWRVNPSHPPPLGCIFGTHTHSRSPALLSRIPHNDRTYPTACISPSQPTDRSHRWCMRSTVGPLVVQLVTVYVPSWRPSAVPASARRAFGCIHTCAHPWTHFHSSSPPFSPFRTPPASHMRAPVSLVDTCARPPSSRPSPPIPSFPLAFSTCVATSALPSWSRERHQAIRWDTPSVVSIAHVYRPVHRP